MGEIIEVSSTTFTAQCYRLYAAPPLGAFVRAGSPGVLAVVWQVTTEPLDSSRPVLARGEAAASEEEIYQNNPQISRLLTSRFQAVALGHESGEGYAHSLPPLPPRVHSFVYTCTPQEVARFTQRLDFLHLLVNSGGPLADEVAGACLRGASEAQQDPRAFLMRAGRVLATELSGDLPRLNAILRRIAS